MNLLSVRIDIPYAGDAGGKVGFGGFREGDMRLVERGQGAGKMSISGLEIIDRGIGKGGWNAGV